MNADKEDSKNVQVCTRCIMSNVADPEIAFDDQGHCNYCTEAILRKEKQYFPNERGETELAGIVAKLKEAGKGREYDCLMGLSGGLDSSYLTYLGVKKWGLRIAAVHVDDGFDTEISTSNIAKLCSATDIELITIKPDADQFNALTKAYIKAGVPNLAVPQDNILFSALYDFAKENHISHFLSGGNFALECILQRGHTWDAYDLVNIKDIHRKFGDKPIDKLSFLSMMQRCIDERILNIKRVRPLDYIDYNRDRAFKELSEFCGFEYYGRKHLENYLTAFLQLYWLPKKFGVDKRMSHLSSMIVSGQMTRDEAIRELEEPLYSEEYMRKLMALLCEELEMSASEIDSYISLPGHQHDEYATDKLFYGLRGLYRRVRG